MMENSKVLSYKSKYSQQKLDSRHNSYFIIEEKQWIM